MDVSSLLFFSFQSTGTTLDDDKNEVGYVVFRSIDLAQCPSLEKSHSLVRSKLCAVLLCRESVEYNTTDVLLQGFADLDGVSSTKVLALVHQTFTSCISNVNKMIDVTSMAQHAHHVQRHQWVPNA